MTMTIGEYDYERDRASRPHYHDGSPRPCWANLSDIAKWSWMRVTYSEQEYAAHNRAFCRE